MNTSLEQLPRILVILTGGTICSSTNEQGERFSDAEHVRIVDAFRRSGSPFWDKVCFDTMIPTDILSENMTTKSWNTLLHALRTQVKWEQYAGVILLHGTDTLAYTASLLSLVLAGISVPVCLVSSQLPLSEGAANGPANFRASVELILNGIAPNVYAVYRNSDGVLYLHYGSHLLQCPNHSDDFFSSDSIAVPDPKNACLPGLAFETDSLLLNRMDDLTPCVLRIVPCVGMDYSAFRLEGVRAVVHGTYHSESVCVERSGRTGDYSSASALWLMDRCRELDIPLFLAPCSPAAYKYESTGDILAQGACHIRGTTAELAYVKTLVGCALGLSSGELAEFVNTPINHEILN